MKKKKVFRKAGNKPGTQAPNATVVFVPSTRGSTLVKSLKEDEERMAEITGFRIKFQEAGGSILANAFNTNLGIGQPCGRKSCPPCEDSGGEVNCKARNILYESVCRICNPRSSLEEDEHGDVQPSGRDGGSREGVYIGESSRSLHERAVEHVRDAGAFSAKSHIIKHWMTSHPSLPNPPEMGFKVTGRFKDCLTRQVSEALRISWTGDSILNSKAEYGHNTVNRLSVVEDVKERKQRERLEEEQEEIMKELVAKFKVEKSAHLVQPSGRDGAFTLNMPDDRVEYDNENDNENDNVRDALPENDNEIVSPSQATFMNNRPSNVPQVTLGQSNGSPHTPLVYTKGGCEGQDEHPRLKVVHEGVDESEGGLVGERGEDSIEDDKSMNPIITYETDEDEFLDAKDHSPAVATCRQAPILRKAPCEKKNTAKRNLTAPRRGGVGGSGYDLAYFKLWWARMEIEGRKRAKEQSRQVEGGLNPKGVGGRKYANARRRGTERLEYCQNQLEVSQVQENDGVGQRLEGDHNELGVGRGSPVSGNSYAICEQPRDSEDRNVNVAMDTDAGTKNS